MPGIGLEHGILADAELRPFMQLARGWTFDPMHNPFAYMVEADEAEKQANETVSPSSNMDAEEPPQPSRKRSRPPTPERTREKKELKSKAGVSQSSTSAEVAEQHLVQDVMYPVPRCLGPCTRPGARPYMCGAACKRAVGHSGGCWCMGNGPCATSPPPGPPPPGPPPVPPPGSVSPCSGASEEFDAVMCMGHCEVRRAGCTCRCILEAGHRPIWLGLYGHVCEYCTFYLEDSLADLPEFSP